MAINLSKGQEVTLSKEKDGLSKNAFALLLSNGKLRNKEDVIYYERLMHLSGAVEHMGDNLTGEGEGDDEQIMIDLNSIPEEYNRIVLAVNIYQANQRKQHFGMIQNAFIRLVDMRDDSEICIFNLTEDYPDQTAMLFGELNRRNGEWQFNVIGQGTTDNSIGEFARRYQ